MMRKFFKHVFSAVMLLVAFHAFGGESLLASSKKTAVSKIAKKGAKPKKAKKAAAVGKAKGKAAAVGKAATVGKAKAPQAKVKEAKVKAPQGKAAAVGKAKAPQGKGSKKKGKVAQVKAPLPAPIQGNLNIAKEKITCIAKLGASLNHKDFAKIEQCVEKAGEQNPNFITAVSESGMCQPEYKKTLTGKDRKRVDKVCKKAQSIVASMNAADDADEDESADEIDDDETIGEEDEEIETVDDEAEEIEMKD
jgi:hypothetical protein